MAYLFDKKMFICPIHLVNFDLHDHKPYGLSCQHNICKVAIDNLYDNANNQIKCPQCKKINKYDSKNEISQNWLLKDIIGTVTKKESHGNIEKTAKNMEAFEDLILMVKKENIEIEQKIEDVILLLKATKNFNEKMISQMVGYRQLIEESFQENPQKWIDMTFVKKVKEDMERFRISYLKAQDFEVQLEKMHSEQELRMAKIDNQLQQVENQQILSDYCIFKNNVLHFIDNGKWSNSFNYIIKQQNKKKIMDILEKQSTKQIDDAVVLSFLNFQGIGVEEDGEKAKQILDQNFIKTNGRALFLKYAVSGEKDLQALLQSCFLRYNRSFSSVGVYQKKLTDDQRESILCSAAAFLGSPSGMRNLGAQLANGKGIEKNKPEAMEYYLKALQKGYLKKSIKQRVDDYYEANQDFRAQHPNYQIWDKDEDFDEQDIILL